MPIRHFGGLLRISFRSTVLLPTCLLIAGLAVFTFSAWRNPSHVSAQATNKPVEGHKGYEPAYTAEGDMIPPLQYREWTYLTSGLNMNYTPQASGDMSKFDNVFVNPESYKVFVATGTWPDKTVLALESRGAESKGSINKSGNYQSGGIMGLELHVKDEARFPGKWAFFDVASESKATLIPAKATCYSCHAEHAAVDTTFVQFYPTLLPIATKKGTLSAAYRAETPTAQPK